MFNENRLRGKIAENRMSIQELSKKIGINPVSLHRKMNGSTEFSRTEISKIVEVLSLSHEDMLSIFFCEDVS